MSPSLFQIILVIFPITIFMALGAWLRFKGIFTDEARGFVNKIIYNLSLPALIFLGICGQDKSQLFDLKTILPSALTIMSIILVVMVNAKAFRFEKKLHGVLASGALWGNVGYLGLPVIRATYGQEGLEVAVVINAFLSPAMLIISSLMIQKTSWKMVWGSLVSPPTASAFLGLILVSISDTVGALPVFNTHYWEMLKGIVFELCDIAGTLGLPLGLMAVGASLDFTKGSIEKFRRMLVTESIAKLLLCPMLCWMFVTIIPGISEMQRNVSVILMAMPASIAYYAIITDEKKNTLAASHLGMSTILCCFTLPMWMVILL